MTRNAPSAEVADYTVFRGELYGLAGASGQSERPLMGGSGTSAL